MCMERETTTHNYLTSFNGLSPQWTPVALAEGVEGVPTGKEGSHAPRQFVSLSCLAILIGVTREKVFKRTCPLAVLATLKCHDG